MANRDTTLDLPILENAKVEFIKNGFEKASLKEIANKAGVTTGAIYKRYNGKEDLFCAIVEDCLLKLNSLFKEKAETDYSSMTDEELKKSWRMDESYMLWWFDLLLKYREEYILLLMCAAGTKYENFQHEWVEILTDVSYRCYEELYSRNITDTAVSRKEMHVLFTAYWATIYEPFIHDFSKEEIKEHCKIVCQLFNWERIFHF